MPLVVRSFALRRPVADLHAFIAELQGPRRAESEAAFKRYGILQDWWYLQDTPHGQSVLVVTVVEDDAKVAQYAACTAEFEAWFKSTILELSGSDPNESPYGPPSQLVFASTGGTITPIGGE